MLDITEQPVIEGKYMPFETVNESWNEYALLDGNTLLVKLVLTKVLKTDRKKPTGEPIYNIEFNPVVTAYTKEQGYVQAKR